MKIRMEETVFEGTPAGIIDQLRQASFCLEDSPDTGSFLKHLRNQFVRLTDLPCELPDGSLDEQARTMLERLAYIGALDIMEEA